MAIKKLTHDELEKLAQNITAPVTQELIGRQKNLEEQTNALAKSVNHLALMINDEVSRKDEREAMINRQLGEARKVADEVRSIRADFDDLRNAVRRDLETMQKAVAQGTTDTAALLRWRDHLLARLATLER